MFRRQSSRGDGGITGLLGHQKTSALLGTLRGSTTLPPILLLTPNVTTEIITWLVGSLTLEAAATFSSALP